MSARCCQGLTLTDLTSFAWIGSGSYSDVYSAIHQDTGTRVAVKIFTVMPEADDAASRRILAGEMDIHRDLSHPHIAQYFGAVRVGELLGIVMELADGRTLLARVLERGPLPEPEARDLFGQLADAVHYLHVAKGVIHRDIKLENILLTRRGAVKLIDFGFAYRKRGPMSERWGSGPYTAPEVLVGGPYDEAIDIWSLGIVLYAIVTARLPERGARAELGEVLSADLSDLLCGMLEPDANQRLNIEEVCSHPWLSKAPSVTPVEHALDPGILNSLSKRRAEIDFLTQESLRGQDTAAAALYRILESTTKAEGEQRREARQRRVSA
jgi:serine/threonine protein kinase